MTVLLVIAAIVLGTIVLFKSVAGGMLETPTNVKRIAQAIAFAEGFYSADPDVRPRRNHNPGDMTQDLIGKAVGRDGDFVVYSSDEDGWDNLYKQIDLWISGGSSHADADSTIEDISQFYTTTDQTAWATNVANHLGVSLNTSIGEIA